MKFYFVYQDMGKDVIVRDWRGQPRGFTKSDMYWFGIDGKVAMKQFRTLAKRCRDGLIPHIKCIDLDEVPELIETSLADKQINELSSNVVCLNDMYKLRFVSNKKGEVTMSIKHCREYANEPGGRLSVIHETNVNADHFSDKSVDAVLPVIVDGIMKRVDIFVPIKVNFNGKLLNKYQPRENYNG